MTTKTMATGAALAFAAATLFAGLTSTMAVAEEAKVHCYGVNGCKGQGFKSMTLAECNAAKGTVGE